MQVERIQERTEILKNHIESGKIVDEINDPQIRELTEGNYRIIYKVINVSEVNILMVHHGAKDLKRRI